MPALSREPLQHMPAWEDIQPLFRIRLNVLEVRGDTLEILVRRQRPKRIVYQPKAVRAEVLSGAGIGKTFHDGFE
jgi:hypothetical protein